MHTIIDFLPPTQKKNIKTNAKIDNEKYFSAGERLAAKLALLKAWTG